MLKISNVSKTFNIGTINEKKALRNISLHLEPEDFVTIIGAVTAPIMVTKSSGSR